MTITFLRNKRPELGSSLGTAVWGFGTDACAGTAERPYYSEENPYYFVPKDKQQAKHAGQPGGYSHYLVGATIKCQKFESHESPYEFLSTMSA